MLDDAVVLWFPGPASATGEDVVELHIHGGRAVQMAVLDALDTIPGLRLAHPGEFTRRALRNGRIDLVQAEGLADLLSAETQDQRRAALAMADGHLSHEIMEWRERVLILSARLEVMIDYADEEGAEDAAALAAIHSDTAALRAEWSERLAAPPVEDLHDGMTLVLAGPPNAGKSSLFNTLAGRDAAIVTPVPGTTRDRIEAVVIRSGRVYRLIDTAGLRDTDDPIEQIGVARSNAAIAGADIILWLGDVPPTDPSRTIWVWSRCDGDGRSIAPPPAIMASARTGQGLSELWNAIDEHIPIVFSAGTPLNKRQRSALARAVEATAPMNEIILFAESLRAARAELDSALGRGGLEPLLDTIFSRFCLGK